MVLEIAILTSYSMAVWAKVKTIAPRCRRPRAIVHRVVRGAEGQQF